MRLFLQLPATLVLLFCAAAPATAQNDDGLLYFPPKLTVGVQAIPEHAEAEDYPLRLSPSLSDQAALPIPLSIEERTLVPLPMVFFDRGSYIIPERYRLFTGHREAEAYVEERQPDKILVRNSEAHPKYYEILNIFGYRLSHAPAVTLALQGGYSAEPGEDETVAAERAQVVKEYFVDVWKIAPERITLLPPRPMCDSAAHIFRQEEGRRVILYVSDPELYRGVRHRTATTVTPEAVFTFDLDTRMPPDQVEAIELIVRSDRGETLSEFSIPAGTGGPTYRIVAFGRIPPDVINGTDRLSVTATVSTRDGSRRVSNVCIVALRLYDVEEANDFDREPMRIRDARKGWSREEEEERRPVRVGPAAYFSIPFFESGDTTLLEIRKVWADAGIDALRRYLAINPIPEVGLTLEGKGEADDIPGIRSEQLLALANAVKNRVEFDRTDFPRIRLIPLSVNRPEEVTRAALARTTDSLLVFLRQTHDEAADGIVAAWESITAEEEPDNRVRDRTGKFLAARAEAFSRYLTRRMDTAILSGITIETTISFRVWLIVRSLPEERFYDRSVSVSVVRPVVWSRD